MGVWAAGGVAVPLNPDTKPTAAARILVHARPRLIVTRQSTCERLGFAGGNVPVLALAQQFQQNRALLETMQESSPAATDESGTAMLLYTSGTTGEPKGVILTHSNLLANTRSIVSYLELGPSDSIVNVLPFVHSYGNSVLLTHLAAGAKLVIENRFAFPSTVVETMQNEKPTGFAGVPATYYVLLNRSPFSERDWSFLRYVCQAGGGMRVETIKRLREILPSTRIYHHVRPN